jgi:multidrug efflux pump subunit AcrB
MISFFKKNRVSILIITIFIALYGISSVITIPKEAMPSVNL